MFYLREYPEFFAAVPLYYWPVLCWELFWHRRWCEAELARRGGVDMQIIVSVTWNGRVVVRFIGDEPGPDWQTELAAHVSAVSKLTSSSPFALIDELVVEAVLRLRDPSQRQRSAPDPSRSAVGSAPLRLLLDPG